MAERLRPEKGGHMYARVTTVKGDPARAEKGIEGFRDGALPIVRKADGFRGGMLLVDRQSGKGIAVSLWDSEDSMNASDSAVKEERTKASRDMGAGTPTVARYEVAVFEMP
jgi:heme-degrading monooxygenase HmoA